LDELKRYFSLIENIDYKPIYAINLLDKIPENQEIKLNKQCYKELNFNDN